MDISKLNNDEITSYCNDPAVKKRKTDLVEPVPGRCHFYLEMKRRYCRVVPIDDHKYCNEHLGELKDPNLRKRVSCPLDPRHTCYEDVVEKHIKKCNSRPAVRECFYEQGINAGSVNQEVISDCKVSVKLVPQDEIKTTVVKVEELYKEYIDGLQEEICFHPVLKAMATNPQMGDVAQKHIQQQASLVGNMERLGLLAPSQMYVEFGAGKGGLSHWVQLAITNQADNEFMLIDKGSCRYKMDNYHKRADQGPSFERIKIDIQHLNLGKVQSIKNNRKPIIGIGKHLCGGATDLMLRCMMETMCSKDDNDKSLVSGIVLALCCHHRCSWQSYVGKHFMQQCGIGPRLFHLMCSMTSWATCSSPHVEPNGDAQKGEGSKESADYNHHRYGHLLPQERERIGYWCKNLIDYGRACYLQSRGFNANIVAYVHKTYTIENTALMATRSNTT